METPELIGMEGYVRPETWQALNSELALDDAITLLVCRGICDE